MLKHSVLMVLAGILCFFAAAKESVALTDAMCAENESCVVCREELKCQKCYFACHNKYGKLNADIQFTYRLKPKELRALGCYKKCWGEELVVEFEEDVPEQQIQRSFHKTRETTSK